MEHVEGRSVADEVADGRPLDAQRAVRLACDLVMGLAELHRCWVFHGCVTPANVLIDAQDHAVLRPPPLLAILSPPEAPPGTTEAQVKADLAQAITTLAYMLTGGATSDAAALPAIEAVMRRADAPGRLRTALMAAASP